MTFLELQQELLAVAAARFKEGQRNSAKFWINNRYAAVWGLEDWTFRKATGTITVTAGVASAPTDFGKPIGIWASDGTRLDYVDPRAYYDATIGATISTSPAFFTMVNGVPQIPVTAGTFTTHYDKKLTLLSADSDVPALPVEHHYMLVHGATYVGSVQVSDFTYQFAQQQWQNNIDEMRQNYLDDQVGEPMQWGSYMDVSRQ